MMHGIWGTILIGFAMIGIVATIRAMVRDRRGKKTVEKNPEDFYTPQYKEILRKVNQKQKDMKERNKRLVLEYLPDAVYEEETPRKAYWPGEGERLRYMIFASPIMSMAFAEGKTPEEMWEKAARRVIYEREWKVWCEDSSSDTGESEVHP